jgi:hypothetical protein
MDTTRTDRIKTAFLLLAAACLVTGLDFMGQPEIASLIWIAAAFGYLTSMRRALLQEALDVAVILNALRTLPIVPHEPTLPIPKAVSSAQADIEKGATP